MIQQSQQRQRTFIAYMHTKKTEMRLFCCHKCNEQTILIYKRKSILAICRVMYAWSILFKFQTRHYEPFSPLRRPIFATYNFNDRCH